MRFDIDEEMLEKVYLKYAFSFYRYFPKKMSCN